LNACEFRSNVGAVRWLAIVNILALLMAATGCDSGGPPPPEGQLSIENVAKWYSLYRADNGGKTPTSEEKFVSFIQNKMKSRGEALDIDQLLTSPRDGQRYVIQYGKPNSKSSERNVAVHEKEGYRGKKLVAFEASWSREVDDAELQSLLTAE